MPNQILPVVFPIFLLVFAAFWTAITCLLGAVAGWYGLARRYPDRAETPLLRIGGQSGSMGIGVSMSGILTLSACPSGLRVSIWRLFGPFSRPFFVPWEDIRSEKQKVLFIEQAKLTFGSPAAGTLKIFSSVWDVLQGVRKLRDAKEARDRLRQALSKMLLQQGLIPAAIAAAFFYFAPKLLNNGVGPPLWVCLIFPGLVFAIGPLVQYLRLRPRL